jgi:hypothetical protein
MANTENRELTNEESALRDTQARQGGVLTKEQRRAAQVQEKEGTERVVSVDQLPDVLRRSGVEVAVGAEEIASLQARSGGQKVIAFVQTDADVGTFDQPVTMKTNKQGQKGSRDESSKR